MTLTLTSAPFIWIVTPALIAIIVFAVRRWERVAILSGVVVAALLAWLAWQLPIGERISLGPWPAFPSIVINDTMLVLGRRFVITDSLRPILILIYFGMALWFGGAWVARVDRLFVPFNLAISALLTGVLAVQPFLFSALLIQIAVLVSVPVLSPPGKQVGRGVLRFLVFETLGMPFILFTGWMLEGLQAGPGDPVMLFRAAVVMGLGFAFVMAIFPFHTWIPMLAEEAHPYAAAFLFFILPAFVSVFGLIFLYRFPWINTSPIIQSALQFVGLLMVVTGGVWAAFQRHLGRILGYAAIVEIGVSLLALSLGAYATTTQGTPLMSIFFAQLLPRGVAMAVWALALAVILNQAGGQPADLRYRNVQGLAYQMPLASGSLILAQLSIAGLPLLAGFPVRLALWTALSEQSLATALIALAGSAGLIIAALRTLAVLLIQPEQKKWKSQENIQQLVLLMGGWIMLFVIGLLPQLFLPPLARMALIFATTAP